METRGQKFLREANAAFAAKKEAMRAIVACASQITTAYYAAHIHDQATEMDNAGDNWKKCVEAGERLEKANAAMEQLKEARRFLATYP